MASRRFVANFEKGSFYLDLAVCDLPDACQEIARLDSGSYHLWIIVDIQLFCEYSTFFVFLVDKLIPNFDNILQSSFMSHNFRLIFLKSKQHCFTGKFCCFLLGQPLDQRLFACFMSCFHRCFLSNRIILYRLNKLILLLLHLVFFTLHYDFLQFFLIFFTFFFYSIAKSFPQFKSISFYLIVFFSCEFMTLTSVPNVASPLLNISTLKPFLVQIIKVSQ